MQAVGSLDVAQFRDLIVRPTLGKIGLASDAAERLIMGTAAHESGFHFLAQIGGPALGLFQIEPATHADLWNTFLIGPPKPLAVAVGGLAAHGQPFLWLNDAHDQLASNLAYATAICRCLYYRISAPLPDADDLPGLAAYWKRYYNTPLGAGTPEQFIADYQRLVAPVYS
jgi:hypothetical protein